MRLWKLENKYRNAAAQSFLWFQNLFGSESGMRRYGSQGYLKSNRHVSLDLSMELLINLSGNIQLPTIWLLTDTQPLMDNSCWNGLLNEKYTRRDQEKMRYWGRGGRTSVWSTWHLNLCLLATLKWASVSEFWQPTHSPTTRILLTTLCHVIWKLNLLKRYNLI